MEGRTVMRDEKRVFDRRKLKNLMLDVDVRTYKELARLSGYCEATIREARTEGKGVPSDTARTIVQALSREMDKPNGDKPNGDKPVDDWMDELLISASDSDEGTVTMDSDEGAITISAAERRRIQQAGAEVSTAVSKLRKLIRALTADAGSPDQLLVSNGGQTRLDEGDIDCLATARPEPTLDPSPRPQSDTTGERRPPGPAGLGKK